jgi:hypothetical protein
MKVSAVIQAHGWDVPVHPGGPLRIKFNLKWNLRKMNMCSTTLPMALAVQHKVNSGPLALLNNEPTYSPRRQFTTKKKSVFKLLALKCGNSNAIRLK